jgi:PAS domain S-box-containing protein
MDTSSLPIDYQQLFRSLPENYLLLAPDATIIDNTDSHVAVSLKPREEVVGRSLFDAYPSVDKNEGDVIFDSHEYVRRFLQPHTMPLIRYDLQRPEEQGGGFEELYWQATHFPILDDNGKLKYILQRTQDVTEQLHSTRAAAKAQQQLADEQARTLFILDSLPVLIWTATPDGQRDYFNPRWLAFTGRTMGQELGEQWMTNLHPDDRDRVRAHWRQCVDNGEPYQIEYRLRRADGQYRWILVRAVPRRDSMGQITLWVGGATDIHEQKLMVEELLVSNEQQAALSEQAYHNYQLAQQQRQTLYSLLMQAPAYVSIVRGSEHRYEFANEQFMQLVGEVPVVGHTVTEVLPEVEAQGLIAVLDHVYQTGETYRAHEKLVRINRGDGQLRDAYFSFIYQRFDEGGKAAGITAYAYEVTELINLRQALGELGPEQATQADISAVTDSHSA